MAQAQPETAQQLISHARDAIERTYPGWRINRSRHGMWVAVRVGQLTPAQRAAGLLHHIIQPSSFALSEELDRQSHVAYRIAA